MPSITITDLTNAKLDVDHIAEVATSTMPSATDRLGNLKDTVKGAIDSLKAYRARGAWAAATAYLVKDVVLVSGTWYVCLSAHTSSGTFASDVAAYWGVFQGLTKTELATSSGASLSGYALAKAGAILQSIADKLDSMPRVEDMIPKGATDHAPYFNAALQLGGSWRVGAGPFTFVVGSANFTAGAKIFCDGTVINHNTTAARTFSAVNVDEWGIYGDLTINGAGKADAGAIGVYRQGGNRFVVENVRCKNISGYGFYEAVGTHVTPRGDEGVWSNCSAVNCWTGREDVAGESTEYNHWLNFNASGCRFPNVTAAGNNRFAGGNIVDNDNGVWVKGGPFNNNHGGFVGVNINHNTGWNIRLSDVSNGESFSGCHCYGDSTSIGRIWLERSKGFLFTGGIMDASVQCDDPTGYSFISTNYCPDSGNADSHTGNGAKKVIYRNNSSPSGMWKLNDPGTCYVRSTVGAAGQALTSGVAATVKFNATAYDTRDAYEESTGVFTLPWLGNFRISGSLQVEGTTINPDSANANSYVMVMLNGTAKAFAPLTKYSNTGAVCSFSVDFGGAAGTTLSVQVVAIGTGLAVTGLTSSFSISEVS